MHFLQFDELLTALQKVGIETLPCHLGCEQTDGEHAHIRVGGIPNKVYLTAQKFMEATYDLACDDGTEL